MLFVDLLFSLAIALALTLVFAVGFRNRGPWASLLVFFAIVLLGSWAGGLWIAPFGPVLFNVYWLPFLLAGVLFALLLAATVPTAPPRSRREAIEQAKAEEATVAGFNVFLLILLIAMIVAVIVAYLQ